MELDDLLLAWKAQDKYIDQHLKAITVSHLLQQQSKGILNRILKRLTLELLIIIFLIAGFNLLFFMVDLPYSISRCICFGIFNIIGLSTVYRYIRVITQAKTDFMHDVAGTLEKIIRDLNHFRIQNNLLNMPVGLLCIIMFAGAQDLIYWLPWLLIEFFLWRWVFIPKMKKRFESYITDLEYSLNNIKEIKG